MDLVNLLPSPPLFFGQFVRLALSLLKSTVHNNYRRSIQDRRTLVDFDVDSHTGFFPRRPLPRLTGVHDLWEAALDQACQNMCLGVDTNPQNMKKHAFGDHWRNEIAVVRAVKKETRCCTSDTTFTVAHA